MREETSSIESDAEDEFCTKQAHSGIPRLMADDVHLNVAPSLKVRVSKQPTVALWPKVFVNKAFRGSFEKSSA